MFYNWTMAAHDDAATHLSLAHQCIGLLYALTGMVGLTGNLLVFVTFLKERSRAYFHSQLALGNCLYLLSTVMAGPSALRGRWLFDDACCQGYGIYSYATGCASLLFASVICIECYAITCFNHWYERQSGRMFVTLSIAIWTISLIFALLSYVLGNGFTLDKNGGTSCGLPLNPGQSPYLWGLVGGSMTSLLLGAVSAVHAYRESRTDEKQFSPLFNNRQLVKISIGILFLTATGNLPYAYRIITSVSSPTKVSSFIGVELTYIFSRMAAALCPLSYFMFGREFRILVQAIITGVDPEKKAV